MIIAPYTRAKRVVDTHYGLLGWNYEGILVGDRRQVIRRSSGLPHPIETRHPSSGNRIQVLRYPNQGFGHGIARNDSARYKRLAGLVGDLHITILINNVGKSHDTSTPFLEAPGKEMDQIISISIDGTLKVTQSYSNGCSGHRF